MLLLNLEKKYWKSLNNQIKQLENIYDDIKSNVPISLEKRDITKAILLRMKAYYNNQEKLKIFLNKGYSAAASDFFVEAIVFYLKLVFEIEFIDFDVCSEKALKRKRGSIRPDISISKNDNVKAIIECKTQLGWNRHKWEEEFKEREAKLKCYFPKAEAFLLVMTSKNWAGFPDNSRKVGKQYYTLSSEWPTKISDDESMLDFIIENPIEELFKRIISLK